MKFRFSLHVAPRDGLTGVLSDAPVFFAFSVCRAESGRFGGASAGRGLRWHLAGLHVDGPAKGRTALCCSGQGGAVELATQTLSAALEQPRQVSSRCALRAPTSALRCAASTRRPARCHLSPFPTCSWLAKARGSRWVWCLALLQLMRQAVARETNVACIKWGARRTEAVFGWAPWWC